MNLWVESDNVYNLLGKYSIDVVDDRNYILLTDFIHKSYVFKI